MVTGKELGNGLRAIQPYYQTGSRVATSSRVPSFFIDSKLPELASQRVAHRFWRYVQTGETPRPYRVEAARVVDMSESNSWAEFADLFCATRSAFLDHERAKPEREALMPDDAKVGRSQL
jgi:hypothetical protein